jgi:hypothetical protein
MLRTVHVTSDLVMPARIVAPLKTRCLRLSLFSSSAIAHNPWCDRQDN